MTRLRPMFLAAMTATAGIVAAVTAATASATAVPRAAQSVVAPRLLIADSTRALAPTSDLRITRQLAVRFDLAALESISASPRALFAVPLFDDDPRGKDGDNDTAAIKAQVDQLETRTLDSFTCTGHLTDESDGWFVLSREDDAAVLHIFSPTRGTFEARAADDGLATLSQLDPSAYGDCACNHTHEIHSSAPPPLAGFARINDTAADDDNAAIAGSSPSPCDRTIDVLVLYTPIAAYAAGGTNAIRALAYASVAVTNLTWHNSGIDAHLRLVHSQEIKYDEVIPPAGDLGTDLLRLWNPSDGYMDSAAATRDAHHADVVCLIEQSYSNFCGIGFVMTSPAASFESYAMCVVQQFCAIGNLSFPHELGHNLGCQHNVGDGSTAVFPYAFGLSFIGQSGQAWRTIMAIGTGTRVPHNSNPDVLFDGVPTGIPAGRPGAADEAKAINITSAVAADFRSAAPLDCNANGIDDACDIAAGISFDANDNGVPDECDPIEPGVPGMELLIAGDGESFERLGSAVAAGNDRLVIGAELDDDGGFAAGSAYVYRRENNGWVFEAKLLAADVQVFKHFGRSVAITPDGQWIIVGAYRDGLQIPDAGAAYIYHRAGTTWTQDAKITNPMPAQAEWFGWSVAIEQDARGELTAVIGTPLDAGYVPYAGAVHVYQRNAGAWILAATLKDAAGVYTDYFGYSVAIEGDTIVVGSPFADRGDLDTGAVSVFHRKGQDWIQQPSILASDRQPYDKLGAAVAISQGRVLAGAAGDDDMGERAGAAYVFEFRKGAKIAQTKLHALDAAQQDLFGYSVSLRGGTAVIGSTLAMFAGSPCGVAYRFDLTSSKAGAKWTQTARLSSPDAAANDNLGAAVSISPDGSWAAIGVPLDDSGDCVDAGGVRTVPLPH